MKFNLCYKAVDICNLSPYVEEIEGEVTRATKFKTKQKIKLSKLRNNLSDLSNTSFINMAEFYIKEVLNEYEDMSSSRNIKSYGHDLKAMLLNCKYQKMTCSFEDFSWYHK